MVRVVDEARQYVIERSSEFLREWWTGSSWSDDYRKARWYAHEPDAPRETSEENAKAVRYPEGVVGPG
jgi:hypothetical protein